MEKVNIHICIPSTGMCKAGFTYSLAQLLLYFNQHKSYPETVSQAVTFRMAEGSGISKNREGLVDGALEDPDMTHILFLDEDMGFAPNILNRLLERRQPIAIVNYRMRHPPANFTAIGLDGRPITVCKEVSGLEEAKFGGFGVALIERKVFESVAKPRFLCEYNQELQDYSTEDVPFYLSAKKAGFKCLVDHDASRDVWHCGGIVYHWANDYSTL